MKLIRNHGKILIYQRGRFGRWVSRWGDVYFFVHLLQFVMCERPGHWVSIDRAAAESLWELFPHCHRSDCEPVWRIRKKAIGRRRRCGFSPGMDPLQKKLIIVSRWHFDAESMVGQQIGLRSLPTIRE